MNTKVMNTEVAIVGAVLALAAAAFAYKFPLILIKPQFLLTKPCTCTIVGGSPVWSGKLPCPPAGVPKSRCPYP